MLVLNRSFHDEGGEITVTSTGPDRALELSEDGLRHAAGNSKSDEIQDAFCGGDFDLAENRLAAQERARSFRFDRDYVPIVEAAMGDLPLLLKDEIRLDAILRRAMALERQFCFLAPCQTLCS